MHELNVLNQTRVPRVDVYKDCRAFVSHYVYVRVDLFGFELEAILSNANVFLIETRGDLDCSVLRSFFNSGLDCVVRTVDLVYKLRVAVFVGLVVAD